MSANPTCKNKNKQNNKSKKTCKNFCIKDEVLAYKIIDAGLLNKMCGVAKDRYNPTKKVWFFERDFKVKQVIDTYCSDKKKDASICD